MAPSTLTTHHPPLTTYHHQLPLIMGFEMTRPSVADIMWLSLQELRQDRLPFT